MDSVIPVLYLLSPLIPLSGAQSNETLSSGLERKLYNSITRLKEISLRLRTREDAFRPVVQFFLNQTMCPVKVFLSSQAKVKENRHNVLLAGISELKILVETYSSRFGTQFYILENSFEPEIVTNISRSIWERWGQYKNYFITSGKIYFYNPFTLIQPGYYGALQEASDDKDSFDITQNLNGYPLRTYLFRSVFSNLVYDKKTGAIQRAVGADSEVAYSIRKMMNFTINLLQPDGMFFGHRLNDGTFDGALGRTIRYESDLTLTGFFVKDYLTDDIEFTVTVSTDELCCYVAKAKRIPQSILPLFSVKIDMWLGFIGAAFLWAFIWCLIRKCNLRLIQSKSGALTNKFNQSYQYFRILIDTWVVWVRANISRYPPFSSEKIFVISLCLVSVIFGAIFESSLATVYINPLYYKDINTLQELDESRLKILIKHAAMKDDLFTGSSSPVFMRLDKKLVHVLESENRVINIMAHRGGGMASVTRASSLILDDITYILSRKIHLIPECPKKYMVAYALPRESPYRQRINDLLLRFLNAGLIDHWIEMMYHKARLGVLKVPEVLKVMGGDPWKVLTIEDLQLAFYVIVLGSMIASMILICEIFIVAWCRWRRNLNKVQ